jgi:hypothetical protein
MGHPARILGVLALFAGLICVRGMGAAEAQSLTPGSVLIAATFEAISVRAQYSGDSNSNGSATIQFRRSGETSWHYAYPPFIERRTTIGGVANPYASEARGSIVGLTPNTAYQVQVTWADPDGISGAQPSVVQVSTLSYAPPTGGSTITVTDNASLASALGSVSAGQTIHLNPGTYAPFTISRSGTAAAWITIEGDSGGGTVVSGTGVNQNILVNGNFLMIKNLTLGPSDWSALVLASGTHDIFVQDNVIQNVSFLCGSNPNAHYGDAGITINSTANIYILRNQINSTALNAAACTLSPIYNSPGTGIQWFGASTLVVQDNVVAGGFRDAIAIDNSNNLGVNVDLKGNTVSGYKDDGLESKGGNVNVRIWSNRIIADGGDTCIAGNTNTTTNLYGPLYIFRNTCLVRSTNTNGVGTTAFKLGGVQMFIFHNSTNSSMAPFRWDTYVGGGTPGMVVLNNAAKSSGSMIDYASPTASVFDYNVGVVTSGASYAYLVGGVTYDSFAAFQAGTGQESHGVLADPLFLDDALHIGSTSAAVDRGIILPNFNSLDSAWPYSGSAPDIGAFELGGLPPLAPTSLIVH